MPIIAQESTGTKSAVTSGFGQQIGNNGSYGQKSPDFGRGFLLPLDDICNIGEPVVFSIYMQFKSICDIGKITQI